MAACVFETDGRAAGAGRRFEELEVDVMAAGDRGLERFLEACGVAADEVPATISRAHAVAADSETVVLGVAIEHGRAVPEVQSAAVSALVAA